MPALRAICDRLIYDIACLEHAVRRLPPNALDRPLTGGEWSTRHVLAHLAAYQDRHEAVLVAASSSAEGAPTLPPLIQSETVAEAERLDFQEQLTRLDAGRDQVLRLLGSLDPALLESAQAGGRTLGQRLDVFSRHVFTHGLDVVSTFPELHTDALLLTWTLQGNVEGNPAAAARQHQIRESAASQLAALREAGGA